MSAPFRRYQQALVERRIGNPSLLGPDAVFPEEVKPDFYADARLLSIAMLGVLKSFKTMYPPYGLLNDKGRAVESIRTTDEPWITLYRSVAETSRAALERATPPVSSCPYHQVLARKLGRTMRPLVPFDGNVHGLDALRDAVVPGAVLNSALFVSLARRLPALQQLHGSTSDTRSFAQNSVVLLDEPLKHPQQWTRPFIFTLGTMDNLLMPTFLDNYLASRYTKVELGPDGSERLNWAIPTEDFTTLGPVSVLNRVTGSVSDRDKHMTVYPANTRLGDIVVDESTIGCPGDVTARYIWKLVMDVADRDGLWQQDSYSVLQ